MVLLFSEQMASPKCNLQMSVNTELFHIFGRYMLPLHTSFTCCIPTNTLSFAVYLLTPLSLVIHPLISLSLYMPSHSSHLLCSLRSSSLVYYVHEGRTIWDLQTGTSFHQSCHSLLLLCSCTLASSEEWKGKEWNGATPYQGPCLIQSSTMSALYLTSYPLSYSKALVLSSFGVLTLSQSCTQRWWGHFLY